MRGRSRLEGGSTETGSANTSQIRPTFLALVLSQMLREMSFQALPYHSGEFFTHFLKSSSISYLCVSVGCARISIPEKNVHRCD